MNEEIKNKWLADFVAAYTKLARPTAIYLCGYGVLQAVLKNPTVDLVLVAAGIVTGISYFRSQDKRLGVGTDKGADN